MSMQHIGSLIAVDCGDDGYYQGTLSAIDPITSNLTLDSAFKAGVPCGKSVVLNRNVITALKMIKTAKEMRPLQLQTPNPPLPATITSILKSHAAPKVNAKQIQSSEVLRNVNCNGTIQNGWVSRLLSKPNQVEGDVLNRRESSSSAGGDESNSPPPPIIKSRSKNKSSRAYRDKVTSCSVSSESEQITASTPTPLYKRYEPQVPKPQTLTAPSWAVKGAKREKGPCGIPSLDAQNGYGRISVRNNELNKPLDLQVLQTDFDFDTNLQLFDKDGAEPDDEYYESVEKPKMSQNFAHDENIVADPTRVNSWTNVTAKIMSQDEDESDNVELGKSPRAIMISSSCSESTSRGVLPVLSRPLKDQYIKECASYLGNAYHLVVADRLVMKIFDVIDRSNIKLCRMLVLLGSDSNRLMVDRVVRCFQNRNVDVVVFNVAKRKGMPTDSNFEIVVVASGLAAVDGSDFLADLHSAHVVALECSPVMKDRSKLHILMIGTLTAGLYSKTAQTPLILGRTSFAQLCGNASTEKFLDCSVCDVGVPFSWIAEDGGRQLSAAFARNQVIRI